MQNRNHTNDMSHITCFHCQQKGRIYYNISKFCPTLTQQPSEKQSKNQSPQKRERIEDIPQHNRNKISNNIYNNNSKGSSFGSKENMSSWWQEQDNSRGRDDNKTNDQWNQDDRDRNRDKDQHSKQQRNKRNHRNNQQQSPQHQQSPENQQQSPQQQHSLHHQHFSPNEQQQSPPQQHSQLRQSPPQNQSKQRQPQPQPQQQQQTQQDQSPTEHQQFPQNQRQEQGRRQKQQEQRYQQPTQSQQPQSQHRQQQQQYQQPHKQQQYRQQHDQNQYHSQYQQPQYHQRQQSQQQQHQHQHQQNQSQQWSRSRQGHDDWHQSTFNEDQYLANEAQQTSSISSRNHSNNQWGSHSTQSWNSVPSPSPSQSTWTSTSNKSNNADASKSQWNSSQQDQWGTSQAWNNPNSQSDWNKNNSRAPLSWDNISPSFGENKNSFTTQRPNQPTGPQSQSPKFSSAFIPVPPSNPASSLEDLICQQQQIPTTRQANELPITEFKAQILEAIHDHQVVIISGATGSGKTTQVPKYILEESIEQGSYCNIICTQPRRLAATSIAKRVADEIGESVGQTVGYQIGMDKISSNSSTKLLFVTTGILLQMLVHKKSLDHFSHVILDEIHERDLDTDFALVIVKQLITACPHVRLVLMSATFNCEMFTNYFPLTPSRSRDKRIPLFKLANDIHLLSESNNPSAHTKAPILQVGGRCFEVDVVFLEDIVELLDQRKLREPYPNFNTANLQREGSQPVVDSNSMLIAVHIVLEIHAIAANAPEDNAVLVFLPGIGEIHEMKDIFMKFDVTSFWILPLHSSITSEEQSHVFRHAPKGVRKIILATNIAESSVTVPDIRYVIDLGYVKEIYFDPQTNLESLKLQYASKASAVQRQGRAGRVGPGTVFRMYTREFFIHTMADYSPSEMSRCPLESLVLQIKTMKEDVRLLSRAIQPPNLELLNQALINLRNAGGLDSKDNITFLGTLFAALPLDIKLSRLVLLGHIFGFSKEIVDIAANISLRGIFTRSFNQPFLGFSCKLRWSQGSESDSIAALFALNSFRAQEFTHQRDMREFCRQNFLQFNTIQELEDLAKELKTRLKSHLKYSDVPMENSSEKLTLLKLVMYGAFYPNYYVGEFSEKREFKSITNDSCHNENVDPFRSIVVTGLSQPTEAKIHELLRPCGKISQVYLQTGNRAVVEFSKDDPERAVLLALKMGYMKKLVWDLQNSSYFASVREKLANNTHSGQNRGRINRREQPEDEITSGEGVEVVVPTLVPNSWGIKVLPVPTHSFKLTFEAQNFKQVNIDNHSVNSVAIDHSQEFKNCEKSEDFEKVSSVTQRYLAAAFVSSTGNWSERQIARETTLLPPIPLVGPILAILFCPSLDVYLWPNRRRTHYLGVTLQGGQMEYAFTHMVTQLDLIIINDLRLLISLSLTPQGILVDNSQKIQAKLWKLLTRKRKPIHVRRKPRENEVNMQNDHNPENLLLLPIVPKIPLISAATDDDDYDSEEEEREKKKKYVDSIRSRFTSVEMDYKSVACARCHEPVANLVTLEKTREEGKYRLTRCFGMAFELPDTHLFFGCRNMHPVGFCDSEEYFIDANSPLEVQVPDEKPLPWRADIWRNDFEAIGGPAAIKKEKIITKEDLWCGICNYQAKDQRAFTFHINSSSHKEEERYFVLAE